MPVPKGVRAGKVISIMVPVPPEDDGSSNPPQSPEEVLRNTIHTRKSRKNLESGGSFTSDSDGSFTSSSPPAWRQSTGSPRSSDAFVDRKARDGAYFSSSSNSSSSANGSFANGGGPCDEDLERAKLAKDIEGVVAVLTAALAHKDAALVVKGLKLVKKVATDSRRRQDKVAAAGGCNVIVGAMRAFPQLEDVQFEGSGALIGVSQPRRGEQ